MPKNHGRIVSIFWSHKDRCPSFYHSDLHAKFQPIPTGAIREIAPLGVGGKSQLSVTKPAGPLPRRLNETIWRCHARPPSKAGVPPRVRSCPLSLDPSFVLLGSHYLPFSQRADKNPQKHAHADVLEMPRTPARRKLKRPFRNDACKFEPFRLGLGSSSIYVHYRLTIKGTVWRGTSPLDSSCLV